MRDNLSEHEVALVQLCERYGAGRRGPERRALMAKIINMALQRADGNEKLADELGKAFEQILRTDGLKQLDDAEYEIAVRQLLEESMITGLDRFDLIPQTITEYYNVKKSDGFQGLT